LKWLENGRHTLDEEADYENSHFRNPLPDDSGRHHEPTPMWI